MEGSTCSRDGLWVVLAMVTGQVVTEPNVSVGVLRVFADTPMAGDWPVAVSGMTSGGLEGSSGTTVSVPATGPTAVGLNATSKVRNVDGNIVKGTVGGESSEKPLPLTVM